MNLVEKIYAASESTIGDTFETISDGTTSVGDLVQRGINWFLYAAGIIAFFYLVYSGIVYITANGNPDQAKKGQQGLINAIIGIIIITLSLVILNAVRNQATQNEISMLVTGFLA